MHESMKAAGKKERKMLICNNCFLHWFATVHTVVKNKKKNAPARGQSFPFFSFLSWGSPPQQKKKKKRGHTFCVSLVREKKEEKKKPSHSTLLLLTSLPRLYSHLVLNGFSCHSGIHSNATDLKSLFFLRSDLFFPPPPFPPTTQTPLPPFLSPWLVPNYLTRKARMEAVANAFFWRIILCVLLLDGKEKKGLRGLPFFFSSTPLLGGGGSFTLKHDWSNLSQMNAPVFAFGWRTRLLACSNFNMVFYCFVDFDFFFFWLRAIISYVCTYIYNTVYYYHHFNKLRTFFFKLMRGVLPSPKTWYVCIQYDTYSDWGGGGGRGGRFVNSSQTGTQVHTW